MKHPVALAFVALLLVQAPDPAAAGPRPRSAVEINGTTVALGDLFADAGLQATSVVMAAPEPGAQLTMNGVELDAIARRYGLAWQAGAGRDLVVVTRASRHLEAQVITDALAAAIAVDDAGDVPQITLDGPPLRPMVPRGAIASAHVEQLERDPATGRFSAVLVVSASGAADQRFALDGRIDETIEVPVLRSRVRPGQAIEMSDIDWRRIARSALPRDAVTDIKSLIEHSPSRSITPGKPILAGDLGSPEVVHKGALVSMHVIGRNMHLAATGRAQASGAVGDVIAVQNVTSRIVIEALVTGPDRVEVRPPRQVAIAQ